MSLQTNPPSSGLSTPSFAIRASDGIRKPISGTSENQMKSIVKPIIGILVILVLAAIIGTFISHKREETSAAARDALFGAKASFDLEAKALAPAPKPTPVESKEKNAKKKVPEQPAAQDTGAYKQINVDQSFVKSIPALKQVVAQYPGTLSAFEAQMMLGNLYADHGAASNSIAYYSAAVDAAPRSFEKMGALAALAQAQENSGKCADAVQSLDRAINLGVGALKGDLLVAKARCYETLGNGAQAKTTYDQILKDLPNTPFARMAEIYRAKLQ